jgi:hypothetical protein
MAQLDEITIAHKGDTMDTVTPACELMVTIDPSNPSMAQLKIKYPVKVVDLARIKAYVEANQWQASIEEVSLSINNNISITYDTSENTYNLHITHTDAPEESWHELLKPSIQQFKPTSIIFDSKLPTLHLAEILSHLADMTNNFTEFIKLDDCSLDDASFNDVIRMLKSYTDLEELNLSCTNMHDRHLQALLATLNSQPTPSLKILIINSNANIKFNIKPVATPLKILDMINTGLTDATFKNCLATIEASPYISEINYSYTRIGNDSIHALCTSLATTTLPQLKSLAIKGLNLSIEVKLALIHAAMKHPTLLQIHDTGLTLKLASAHMPNTLHMTKTDLEPREHHTPTYSSLTAIINQFKPEYLRFSNNISFLDFSEQLVALTDKSQKHNSIYNINVNHMPLDQIAESSIHQLLDMCPHMKILSMSNTHLSDICFNLIITNISGPYLALTALDVSYNPGLSWPGSLLSCPLSHVNLSESFKTEDLIKMMTLTTWPNLILFTFDTPEDILTDADIVKAAVTFIQATPQLRRFSIGSKNEVIPEAISDALFLSELTHFNEQEITRAQALPPLDMSIHDIPEEEEEEEEEKENNANSLQP